MFFKNLASGNIPSLRLLFLLEEAKSTRTLFLDLRTQVHKLIAFCYSTNHGAPARKNTTAKIKWLNREVLQKFPLPTNAEYDLISEQKDLNWPENFLLARDMDQDLTQWEKELESSLIARAKKPAASDHVKQMQDAAKAELPCFSTRKALLSKN